MENWMPANISVREFYDQTAPSYFISYCKFAKCFWKNLCIRCLLLSTDGLTLILLRLKQNMGLTGLTSFSFELYNFNSLFFQSAQNILTADHSGGRKWRLTVSVMSSTQCWLFLIISKKMIEKLLCFMIPVSKLGNTIFNAHAVGRNSWVHFRGSRIFSDSMRVSIFLRMIKNSGRWG